MKLLDEKRNKLAEQHYKTSGWAPTEFAVMNFHAGWDACAKELEKENDELKRQLDIVKNALRFYANADDVGAVARLAFKDLNKA